MNVCSTLGMDFPRNSDRVQFAPAIVQANYLLFRARSFFRETIVGERDSEIAFL